MKFKETAIKVLKFFMILALLLGSLVVICLIPKSYIDSNVKKSLNTLKKEGLFPRVKFGYNYLLDNYTDALMINTAYSVDSNKPLESAILMRRNYSSDRNDIKLAEIGNENTIQNLSDTIDGKNTEYYEYSRYWHGYLLILRPLLVLTDYTGIRIILTLLINLLFIMATYLIYKKININFAISFFISMIVVSIHLIGLSIQYSSIYIIALLAIIYILKKDGRVKNINMLFLLIGAITCFMDLLTCPIITFCLPMIILIGLQKENNLKEKLRQIIILGLCWVSGFIITWISKWILADIICGTETIITAINKISFYSTSNSEVNASIMQAICKNLSFIIEAIIIAFLLVLFTIEYKMLDKKNRKNYIRKILPYLLISLIPFTWYVFTKNHSFIHARYTYKNLVATIFCFLIIIFQDINILKNDSEIKEKINE